MKSRILTRAAFCSLTVVVLALIAEACSFEVTFRAYLRDRIWRPTWRYVGELAAKAPPENTHYVPYAGMGIDGQGGLAELRAAYSALFPDGSSPTPFVSGYLNWPDATMDHLRDLIREAKPSNESESQELDLLRCKVELRAAKGPEDPALPQVRACFDSYLQQQRTPALASEARGWLARTDFLMGRGGSASKYYLDELASSTSNIQRNRLLESLRLITPTESDLDNYFDTPAHALFAVSRITNSPSRSLAEALMTRLETHENLFANGADSDELILAMMRAGLQMGAPEAVLRYANRAALDSAIRRNGEYYWLGGVAQYQQKEFSAAEAAFKRVLEEEGNDSRMRTFAANALIGVYARMDRPLDQLWIALRTSPLARSAVGRSYAEVEPLYPDYYFELYSAGILGYPGAVGFDAAYLLDVQLTDEQIADYLQQHEDTVDAVRYSRAVRFARRENYAESAKLYEQLGSPRAPLMRQAESLFASTRKEQAAEQRLEALYAYADFLAQNENGIFFNDKLWSGFQTSAFISRDPDANERNPGAVGLTDDEIERYRKLERTLRDEQEEYWRAYQILDRIVSEAGPTDLGRKAARRALVCLRRIHTERFGRRAEIRSADFRLTAWLARA